MYKWRRSVGNVSNMWGNDLIIWQTAWKCGKWLRDLGNGQNNMKWLRYMRHGFSIWETA